MKHKAILIITFLFCTLAVYRTWTQGDTHDHLQRADTIADSAVHYDYVHSDDTEGVKDGSSSPDHVPRDAGNNAEYAGLSRERIIAYAEENYGVDYEWCVWLIGTTWNEGYQSDRYLEYAWACEIVNCYRYWSIYDLDCIWGAYYSYGHAYSGYLSADDMTLQMVWEALTNTDTRIVEVDGMIRWEVEGYYLIYDSDYYNCQVWGQ